MLHVERQKQIIDMLLKNGSVKILDLSKEYEVGVETIRRDLKAIASQIDIELIYGGACIKDHIKLNIVEESVKEKRSIEYTNKQIIAKKAANLINKGDTIALNSGSTVEYILDYISDKTPLSIVTLSAQIALKAISVPNVDVYIPGGKLRNKSTAVVGPTTAQFLKSFNIDKCFFGASAIDFKNGVLHPVIEEVDINMAMLSVSNEKYLVADSTKMYNTSLYTMARIEEFDGFIVDEDFKEEDKIFLQEKEIKVY